MQHGPGDLALRIIDLRHYAQIKARVEYAEAHDEVDIVIEYEDEKQVHEIQFAVVDAMKRERGALLR